MGGHQESTEMTPVYIFTGLWVDGQGHLPSLLQNSCAAVGGSGDRPVMWLEVGAPRGLPGKPWLQEPPAIRFFAMETVRCRQQG